MLSYPTGRDSWPVRVAIIGRVIFIIQFKISIMTLGFSRQINGYPTYFAEKIWAGLMMFDKLCQQPETVKAYGATNLIEDDWMYKLHTIRQDSKDRWKAGNKIHFVYGNRTKNRWQFAPVIECLATQRIEIKYEAPMRPIVKIDDRTFDLDCYEDKGKLYQLAVNDGFDSLVEFFDYFNDDFTGKIIHWTPGLSY